MIATVTLLVHPYGCLSPIALLIQTLPDESEGQCRIYFTYTDMDLAAIITRFKV